MSAVPSDPADPAHEGLRRRALWLAELATARPGFVGQFVKRLGALPGSLRVPHGRSRLPSERKAADDDGLFAAVLAAGPPAEASLVTRPPRALDAETGVVTCVDEAYPERLLQLSDPPPALFVVGRVEDGLTALRERVPVAIVGSRRPSPYGREMATALGRDLAEAGVLVLSGMALGIDAVAQHAALDHGADVATVGVLGCGADLEHPPGNRRLFAEVHARGLLVSEFVWGASPLPWRFPCRNRVLAALAAAVVVVEGGERSGARITARHGLELGREVLAVPGEAGRRLSACPHQLLRDGAGLCESAKDVIEALGLDLRRSLAGGATSAATSTPSDGLAAQLLAVLDGGGSSADELAVRLHRHVGEILAALTELELAGRVGVNGDRYRRRRDVP